MIAFHRYLNVIIQRSDGGTNILENDYVTLVKQLDVDIRTKIVISDSHFDNSDDVLDYNAVCARWNRTTCEENDILQIFNDTSDITTTQVIV